MTIEQLIQVYHTFFPDLPMYSRFENDRMELYYVADNSSYTVMYHKEENHLEVFKYNLKETYPLTTIIEGSPQDIIKLAKLLEQ